MNRFNYKNKSHKKIALISEAKEFQPLAVGQMVAHCNPNLILGGETP